MRVRTIVSLAILFVSLMSWACRERIIVYPPAKAPEAPSPPTGKDADSGTSPPLGMRFPEPSKFPSVPAELLNAEVYFGLGEYPEALREYEAYMTNNPDAASLDRILLNVGLCYALASGSARNLSAAKISLNRLIKEYPGSQYRGEASLILDLIAQVERLDRNMRARNAQIKRLEDELQRLKEIDLKRRPPRPSE
jgi:tetratricopeptide (TPR) repeat protein